MGGRPADGAPLGRRRDERTRAAPLRQRPASLAGVGRVARPAYRLGPLAGGAARLVRPLYQVDALGRRIVQRVSTGAAND